MQTIKNGKRAALGMACLAFAGSIAGGAYANTRYSPAVGLCGWSGGTIFVSSIGQLFNESATTEGHILCPAISDGDLRAGQATSAEVFGWARVAGGLVARACNIPFGGGFGQCGPPSSASQGVQQMSVTTSHADGWTGHASDFHYIDVEIGPKSGSNYNTFWGFGFTAP